MFGRRRKSEGEASLEDFSPEEIVEYALENPAVRRGIIERIREDVEDALEATLVNAIRSANERPPIWWQWLLLFIFGTMAGIGLGIVLAVKGGVVSSSVPPPP